MANIQVYRFGDGKLESREADVSSLGKRPHRRVMREAVIMYEANRRAGTPVLTSPFTERRPFALSCRRDAE